MKHRGIVAIVPMKVPYLAKSRLGDRLTSAQREALSLNMLDRVLQAALSSSVCLVWVVGGGSTVRQRALKLGVEWYEEEGDGLNDALWHAFETAFALELVPMYLPADLPFLTPEDLLHAVKTSGDGQTLVLSPAHRDGGTNAMILPLGSPFRPALGVSSFRRHQDQARALGLPVRICITRGLGLDLDTLEDLEAFEQVEPGLLGRLTGEATSASGEAGTYPRN